MSELDGYTEAYDALRQERLEKRRRNTESSTRILSDSGIEFRSYNNGAHLLVDEFDFWPSTGLFIDRQAGTRGRGVFNMIDIIRKRGLARAKDMEK